MDKPYAVLTIPVISLVVYLATWLAVKSGVISRDTFRKLWNFLLLIAFLGAAGLGFLLALQVNYKFDLPAAALFLKVHVDFGIALLLIALLHLTWHLKYFLHIFRLGHSNEKARHNAVIIDEETHKEITQENIPGRFLLLLPFSLGLTSMSSQIILLREFITVFNGNELIIGIVLANWMLLTGAGAWLGRFTGRRKHGVTGYIAAIMVLSAVAPVTLFALDALRNILFTTGSMAGIFQVFFTSLILLMPFCMASGILFTRLTTLLSSRFNESSIGRVYAWESIGSVAGGVLFNFVLVFFLKPFQAFGVILIVNALILLAFVFNSGRKELVFRFAILCYLLIASIFVCNPDRLSRKFLFPGQDIVSYKDSPFGNIVVTASEGQKNLYENNTLIYTTNNVISNEESVHYAMLQRGNPENVLLIGGCFPGVISEILKYPVKKLDLVETNPWLYRTIESTLGIPNDGRMEIITGDPLISLRKIANHSQGDNKYDAILLNLPDPYTAQLNRFYTLEFMELLKNLLMRRGVVSLSLMATADYMGFSSGQVHDVMYSTLKRAFQHVVVIPGDRNYFLASDSALRMDIATLQAVRGIGTEYVNAFYLDDQSLKQRSEVIMKALADNAPVNRDFEPLAFKGQIEYWLDYFGANLSFLPLVIVLILLAVFLRYDGIRIGLFTAGFAASASEIIILLAFQIIYGYVFMAAGMFITLFMLGLAMGAVLGKKYWHISSYSLLVKLQFVMALIILVILGSVHGFHKAHGASVAIHFGFGLIMLVMAMLTGMIFQVSSVVKKGNAEEVAGSLYSSDLLGSALGALLVSAFVIPELGLSWSLLGIGCLCLLSAFMMIIKGKPAG